MIKFFRKIRQDMIKQNRFSKYLLYAIGEIILVVIGILIALQINNANENNKNKSVKKEYINSLIKDVKSDSIILNTLINDMQDDLDELNSFYERLSEPNATIDTLKYIYNYEYRNFFSPANTLITQTIEALTSTGDINLFDKPIRDEIMRYHFSQKAVILGTQKNMDLFLDNVSNRNLPPIIDTRDSLLNVIPNKFITPIWDDIDNNTFVKEFHSLLLAKKVMEQIIIEGRTGALKETYRFLNFLYQIKNEYEL